VLEKAKREKSLLVSDYDILDTKKMPTIAYIIKKASKAANTVFLLLESRPSENHAIKVISNNLGDSRSAYLVAVIAVFVNILRDNVGDF
jgi:hypothetical protein